MKKLKLILPLIALSLFSCDNYLDVNTSPNDPQASQITPDLTLAAVQTASYSPLVRRMNELGNVFMNNWGANVNSFTGGYAEEFGITMSNNFYEDIWTSVYRSTYEYSNIINHPSADYDNHKAIAKIMKSFYFQYLVDLYGDIPYFDAHQGTVNTNPVYNDDELIYRDLIVQIDEAISMIDNAPANTLPVGAEDVMLGGNMGKWKKFANTLKLRILLREATKAETNAASATYLDTQFANLEQDFITEDLIINPGYSDANNAQQNPWMNLMVELKLTSAGDFSFRQGYNFRRASSFIASKLNSAPTDPRRGRLFKLISGSVVGVSQGDIAAPGGTAPAAMSEMGPGVVVSNDQDGYVMLAAESYFLQAEAAFRYPAIFTADPQSLFDSGIAASFNHLGASLGTYIGDVNAVPTKGYAASADKLEAIMYQKSIALCNTNGIEAWIEYTRTGYINNIPMPTPNNGPATSPTGQKPLRLMYPTSEYASNSANVPLQTSNDAFTTGPFWKQ